MKKLFCCAFCVIVFLLSTFNLHSQNDSISGLKLVDKLIDLENYDSAHIEIDQQIRQLKSQNNIDSLANYVGYVGHLKLTKNHDEAIKKATNFVNELKSYNNNYITKKALLELASFYDDIGKPKKAYEITKEALTFALKIKDAKKANIESIEYSLGIRARDYGDLVLSKKHLLKVLKIRKNSQDKDYESYYLAYNAIGSVMWYSTELDSSMYYYKESLKALEKIDTTLANKYYRPAIVRGNIAVLSQATGDMDKAIELSKIAISDYQKFINATTNESIKLRAKKLQLSSIDNLGSFYYSMGEFNRADELITYSYNEKLKILNPDDPKIMISLIILGQAKAGIKDFDAAGKSLDKALEIINKNPNTQFYWRSAALTTRASIYDAKGDIESAKIFYKKGEKLFRQVLNGDYSKEFLDEMMSTSLFYAKAGMDDKALELSSELYNFIKTSDYKNTLQEFQHALNFAEVNFIIKNYEDALKYSNESLKIGMNNLENTNAIDSILIQFNHPKALLINVKSKYNLTNNKTESFLQSLTKNIAKGILILEQRKKTIKSSDDLNLLISQNIELFNFSKKLNLELYNISKNPIYLNKTIELHESSIYNRIRSRLNLRNTAFGDVPLYVIKREGDLKKRISNSLNNSENINTFFKANSNWNNFLDSLKQTYPKYYKMRYATIEESLQNLQNNIPKNTTVVRYLFINDDLYAYIVNETSTNIFKLNSDNLANNISLLAEEQSKIEDISSTLFDLYKQLWQPFETQITTENIIIIPDKELFNLSFETLTPTKISSFKNLTSNSLLAKHNVSYNFSLLLLNENRKTVNYSNEFVAFAPEFNDKMKNDYKISIADSLLLDKTYLTLLPQPFSVDLAKEYSKLFGGDSFLNEQASKQIFTNNAKEHKIIHIGTHAESNNISPELSRLIFAKDTLNEDNSLYTYEIYNQNLASNLAILTACETGKPTYQAGEGMISLAHAFNYAGSESILTSLWKIDEQSSAKIIDLFYQNILKGLAKDKALQKAKLTYISSAEGRTVSPQYWAGLVLIGDTTPINIQTSSNLVLWFLGIITIILLAVFLKNVKHKKLSIKLTAFLPN